MSYSELPIFFPVDGREGWVFLLPRYWFQAEQSFALENDFAKFEIMNEFPWLKNYPQGVDKTINLYDYPSLLHLLDEKMSKFADRVAFENMGVTLTYKQVD